MKNKLSNGVAYYHQHCYHIFVGLTQTFPSLIVFLIFVLDQRLLMMFFSMIESMKSSSSCLCYNDISSLQHTSTLHPLFHHNSAFSLCDSPSRSALLPRTCSRANTSHPSRGQSVIASFRRLLFSTLLFIALCDGGATNSPRATITWQRQTWRTNSLTQSVLSRCLRILEQMEAVVVPPSTRTRRCAPTTTKCDDGSRCSDDLL